VAVCPPKLSLLLSTVSSFHPPVSPFLVSSLLLHHGRHRSMTVVPPLSAAPSKVTVVGSGPPDVGSTMPVVAPSQCASTSIRCPLSLPPDPPLARWPSDLDPPPTGLALVCHAGAGFVCSQLIEARESLVAVTGPSRPRPQPGRHRSSTPPLPPVQVCHAGAPSSWCRQSGEHRCTPVPLVPCAGAMPPPTASVAFIDLPPTRGGR
jgi:hypothetical protein